MQACILSIGDELVRGQALDTNSRDLSQRLMDRGVETIEHVTIPDSLDRTAAAIERLSRAAPLVITTGGLGPTQDDLTRDALARVLGEPLEIDPDALAALDARLKSRARAMTPAQRLQALRPRSARCLPNPNGTAPGLHATLRTPGAPHESSEVFCLPGPPNEWRPMFDAFIAPSIRLPPGRIVRTRLLHLFGLSEADAASMIPGLMDRSRNPLVGITASGGVLTWRLCFSGIAAPQTAEKALSDTADLIHAAMGRFIFAEGDASLAASAVQRLKAGDRTLACVESCTGGMLGEAVTAVAGASAVFRGGLLTYSNDLKSKLAGVSPATLTAHGAVSAETAHEMARGGLAACDADLALSVTGIAGPDGGTPDKPVGTVWIALAWKPLNPPNDAPNAPSHSPHSPGSIAVRFFIPGQRDDIRQRSVTAALGLLNFFLREHDPAAPFNPPFNPPRLLWEVQRDLRAT